MPNNFNFPFVLSVLGGVVATSVATGLYVWPALRSLPRANALRILACLQAFRFFGLNFIVIGFVASGLNSAVANQIAWGDFIAAALAVVSVAAFTWRWPVAMPVAWIANTWGIADLLNAYYKGATQVGDVGLFAAGIYVPALFVPILLVAHVLAFRLLVDPSAVRAENGQTRVAKEMPHPFATRPQ
jgi:hypothetical protein